MPARRLGTLAVGAALAMVALVGRAHAPRPLTSLEHAPEVRVPAVVPEESAPTTPPAPVDVRAAIARAFSGCVESRGPLPESAFGDFNGDGSTDLAVVVEPSDEHSYAINDDFRNWIVQDLGKVAPAGLAAARPPRVDKHERLLAVVHGHGPAGWRSPEARQAYLLKNAVGTGLSFVGKGAKARAIPGGPALRGDAIGTEVDATDQFVYWTGAGYARWR